MPPDHGLQQIIGAALIDREVLGVLLRDPLALASRFGLTVRERRFIATARARDLEHFAALVENWCAERPLVEHRSADWPADAQLAG